MTDTITWTDKSGIERTGRIEGRGFFAVDRGEEFQVVPDHNPAVVVFLPVSVKG